MSRVNSNPSCITVQVKKRDMVKNKTKKNPTHPWLTPVILAAWEAEIRRITVLGQLG
jgi:hypothetical protein